MFCEELRLTFKSHLRHGLERIVLDGVGQLVELQVPHGVDEHALVELGQQVLLVQVAVTRLLPPNFVPQKPRVESFKVTLSLKLMVV